MNTQNIQCKIINCQQIFKSLLINDLPDVVILDGVSADIDTLKIAKELRTNPHTQNIGIIYITTSLKLEERLLVLDVSDSYLTEPVDCRELAAVINNIYRRISSPKLSATKETWQLSKQKIELRSQSGNIINLTYRELIILSTLAEEPSTPISAKTIIEAIGENWLSFEKNRLELLLSRLRSKIKPYCEDINPIKSIRNTGYKLMIPIKINE